MFFFVYIFFCVYIGLCMCLIIYLFEYLYFYLVIYIFIGRFPSPFKFEEAPTTRRLTEFYYDSLTWNVI